jgi:hypothetical protein
VANRFENVQHVIRVALIFAIGLVSFFVLRGFFVPSDFGLEGFYRAGARVDAQALPLQYAGEADCLTCHVDVADLRAANRHKAVSCETCHGPNKAHVDDPTTVKPARVNAETFCVTCHAKGAGKPAFLPQIVAADHYGTACVDCHAPHKPRIDAGGEAAARRPE